MTGPASVVYLVTGANRGIGLGLVKALAARHDTVVYAGARNPSGAHDLQVLASDYPDKVHILKIVSADEDGNKAAVSEIKAKSGRLDVVVANAGIAHFSGPSVTVSVKNLFDHFNVNAVGTLVLFQACYELLKASGGSPKFVAMTSRGGSIHACAGVDHQLLSYGVSKAAENYISRKLHGEHAKDGIVVFCMCPGATDTEMERNARKNDPFLSATLPPPKTVEETVPLLLARIDEATTENTGGQYVQYDGERIPW